VWEPLLRDPDVPVEELRDGRLYLGEQRGVVMMPLHTTENKA